MDLAKKLDPVNEKEMSETSKTMTREKVENTLTDEIIIGICSPIGSLKEQVVEDLKNILIEEYGYDVKVIKISDFIEKYSPSFASEQPGETKGFTSLMNKINGGDQLRKKHNPACLVELAIHEINVERLRGDNVGDIKNTEDLKSRRICYIFDSLKNKEELYLLRSVYKDIFYQFSIFSPENVRSNNLREKHKLSDPEITGLMDTDEYENNTHGQNVRDTFIDADFFVRVTNKNIKGTRKKIERYLHLIFESSIITPNPDEIAMYEAKSAAGNSACLSRQVGAAITNEKGEIISRGWNDVPKFGGNLYKDIDSPNHRCLHIGYCSNDRTKDKLTENIIEMILKDESFKEMFTKKQEDGTYFIQKLNEKIRKSTKIKDLIEFSRSVHAEMHAIIIGSQLAGNKMVGGKLFCTTYPCHNCGRHIVVAGIKEIYYIEPYVKSLCLELHSDAITEDEESIDKVRILMYDGVAPRRFMEFFIMKSQRKDGNGILQPIVLETIHPKSRLTLQALSTLEAQALHSLKSTGLIE